MLMDGTGMGKKRRTGTLTKFFFFSAQVEFGLCYQVVSAHPILVAGIELFIKFGQ
jgi:hypothetical protein